MRRLFLLLLLALPLSADETPYTISPSSGPTAGGTEVTLKGDFAPWSYYVYFGWVPAATTTRVDEHTLVATTPAHLPGEVDVILFEYDAYIGTELKFTFTGGIPENAFERVLLPIFTPPIRGAYGSEFRTSLELINTGENVLEPHGLQQDCTYTCVPYYGQEVIRLFRDHRFEVETLRLGNPGRFVYLNAADAKHFHANLRVYDTSRSAESFGTAVPVVGSADFRTERFALLRVPRDPRFRSTLRIYADAPTTVKVLVDDQASFVPLRAGENLFDPAYAQFGNFPTGSGLSNVIIEPEENGPAVWAFISVTNNETQHITLITPR